MALLFNTDLRIGAHGNSDENGAFDNKKYTTSTDNGIRCLTLYVQIRKRFVDLYSRFEIH